MLRLKPQTESAWIDLPKVGARVKVRPLTTSIVTAAKSEARKRVAAGRLDVVAAHADDGASKAPTWSRYLPAT
jgi:hypothetical protein